MVEPDLGSKRIEEPAGNESASRLRVPRGAIRRTLVPAVLMCSLLVNGVLTAVLVSRVDGQGVAVVVAQTVTSDAQVPTTTATTRVAAKSSAAPTANPATVRRTRPARVTKKKVRARARSKARATTAAKHSRSVAPPSRASAERKLMLLMLAPHSATVPRRFVDAQTGLLKNNVQVSCKRREKRAFLCSVRLASDGASERNYVQYRQSRTGHDTIRWLRTR